MSSQLTLDDDFEVPDGNPTVVDDPETADWMDYQEFLRLRREREAVR